MCNWQSIELVGSVWKRLILSLFFSDNEFFFLDTDTKISKVAPDSWKKVPTTPFILYFRVKFFVSDISLLL